MNRHIACKYGGAAYSSADRMKDMEEATADFLQKELDKANATIKKLTNSLEEANAKLKLFEELKQKLLNAAVTEPDEHIAGLALSYARRIVAILNPQQHDE